MGKQLNNFLEICEYARKTHIHAFHCIGYLNQHFALSCQPLNVEPWGRIIRNIDQPRKSIQTIAHCDVQGLTEDTVPTP